MLERGHVEIARVWEIEPAPLHAAGWPAGASVRVLSRDPACGAFTGVVRLPPGSRRPAGSLAVESEAFVLEGALAVGGAIRSYGYFDYAPAGAAHCEWTAGSGCTLLFRASGPPELAAGKGRDDERCVRLDTLRLPWRATSTPQVPTGIFTKLLRANPETGESIILSAMPPRYLLPVIEFHDYVEEWYQLRGELRIGTSGLLRPGCYFWRPPYLSHGPISTRTGSLAFMYNAAPIVLHLTDNPLRSAEENRRAFELSARRRPAPAPTRRASGPAASRS